MKSSDCVIKHPGIHSTGMAMVVRFDSFLTQLLITAFDQQVGVSSI